VCSPHLCPARANRTGAPEGTHTRTRETATRVLAALATKLGRDTTGPRRRPPGGWRGAERRDRRVGVAVGCGFDARAHLGRAEGQHGQRRARRGYPAAGDELDLRGAEQLLLGCSLVSARRSQPRLMRTTQSSTERSSQSTKLAGHSEMRGCPPMWHSI